MHRLSYLLGTLALTAPTVASATYTYGVGVAARYGVFAGVEGPGVSLNLRADKFEIEGGAFNTTQDISGQLTFNTLLDSGTADLATINSASITQRGGYAMLKLHPANGSFYFGFGAAATQATATLKGQGPDGGTLDETMTAQRTLGTISVGNVWTPGGVMIGCEWAGYAGVLSKKEKITSKSNVGADASASDLQSHFYNLVRTDAEDSTYNALVVYLGVMLGG